MAENEVLKLSTVQNLINAQKAQIALTKQAEEDAKAAAIALGGKIFVVNEEEDFVTISSIEPASHFEESTVNSLGLEIDTLKITIE